MNGELSSVLVQQGVEWVIAEGNLAGSRMDIDLHGFHKAREPALRLASVACPPIAMRVGALRLAHLH